MTVFFTVDGVEHTHRTTTTNANFARAEVETLFPTARITGILANFRGR